jgi:hypothetical protein
MKLSFTRALVVAAALALSIVPAFAQLTFNGYYRVGSMTNVDTNGNNTGTALQDRIRLNISFVAPDDMFGFKTRLQADSSGTNSGLVQLFTDGVTATAATTGTSLVGGGAITATTTVTTAVTPPATLKYGYGYGKLLDGMVKLSAGYLDLTDYAAVQNVGNYYFGNVYSDDATGANTPNLSGQKGKFLGTALQVWPVEGLSVAATMRTDGSTLGAHHLGFDAYYLIPGFGKALLASQLGVYSTTAASASDDLTKSFVSGGFTYLGFKGLTATAVLRTSAASKTAAAAIGSAAIVEYSSGPLFADLATDIDFTNSHYYVEGEASYLIIPQIKARVYGALADVATANIKINGVSNVQSLGADLVFPIGKGEIQAGVVYGDKAGMQFPILVRANF